jgi:hypothetical protein
MVIFMPITYNFACLGIERSEVQIQVEATHLKKMFLSQINIELNISVANSLFNQFTTIKTLENICGTIQKQIGL